MLDARKYEAAGVKSSGFSFYSGKAEKVMLFLLLAVQELESKSLKPMFHPCSN